MRELLNRLSLVFFGVAILAVAFFFFSNGGDALGNTSNQDKQLASVNKRINELESQVKVLEKVNISLIQIETRLTDYRESHEKLRDSFTKKSERLNTDIRRVEKESENKMTRLDGKLSELQNLVKRLSKQTKSENK